MKLKRNAAVGLGVTLGLAAVGLVHEGSERETDRLVLPPVTTLDTFESFTGSPTPAEGIHTGVGSAVIAELGAVTSSSPAMTLEEAVALIDIYNSMSQEERSSDVDMRNRYNAASALVSSARDSQIENSASEMEQLILEVISGEVLEDQLGLTNQDFIAVSRLSSNELVLDHILRNKPNLARIIYSEGNMSDEFIDMRRSEAVAVNERALLVSDVNSTSDFVQNEARNALDYFSEELPDEDLIERGHWIDMICAVASSKSSTLQYSYQIYELAQTFSNTEKVKVLGALSKGILDPILMENIFLDLNLPTPIQLSSSNSYAVRAAEYLFDFVSRDDLPPLLICAFVDRAVQAQIRIGATLNPLYSEEECGH